MSIRLQLLSTWKTILRMKNNIESTDQFITKSFKKSKENVEEKCLINTKIQDGRQNVIREEGVHPTSLLTARLK